MTKDRPAVALISLSLLALLAAGCAQSAGDSASSGPVSGLVGSWELVSRVDHAPDGTTLVEPSLGSDPVALLIYDRSGRVAAQLMRRDRSAAPTTPAPEAADPNNSGAVNGYDAYFGTYLVDTAAGTLTHTLRAALVPSDVGRSVTRRFLLEGDTLRIEFDARGITGERVTRRLTWRRVA